MEFPVRPRIAAVIVACIAVLTVATTVRAGETQRLPMLEEYRAKYHVVSSGFRAGEIVSTLRRENGEYVFETRGTSRGLASLFVTRQALEISRFLVTEDGLVPLDYRRDAGKSDDEDDTRANFDWDRATVDSIDKGRDVTLPLSPGIIERHILPLAVVLGLRRGSAPQSLTIVERDRIKRFEITAEGSDRVILGDTSYETLKYLQHRDESDRRTTIWFAPELGFLPVRFEIHDERGLRAKIVLEELSLGGDTRVGG